MHVFDLVELRSFRSLSNLIALQSFSEWLGIASGFSEYR